MDPLLVTHEEDVYFNEANGSPEYPPIRPEGGPIHERREGPRRRSSSASGLRHRRVEISTLGATLLL
jgi:hypothetical protein